MSFAAWTVTVLAWLALDVVVVFLFRRPARPAPASWFDHERFLGEGSASGVVERVNAACGVLVHPCSYGGDLLEYPVAGGWDEQAILATLAEIEAL